MTSRTLSPREFDFFMQLVEELAKRAYTQGHEDGAAGKPLKTEGFKPSKANQLAIKTNLKKYVEKR